MPAVWELLEETEARESLQTFIGNVASAGEVDSWDEFLEVIGNTQLPTATRSVIMHHGQSRSRVPDQVRINTRLSGWNFLAINVDREDYNGTQIQSSRHKFVIGPRERSLVMFHGPDATNAVAMENRDRSQNLYLVGSCRPDFLEDFYKRLGDSPTELDHDAVIRLDATAVEAKLKAPERLNGFLRVSSQLVADLLSVTNEY